jgi:hypothetical protein
MTEWCYAGEPSEGGAPEGCCSGLGGRSSRAKTGFTVMVRHFVAGMRLSFVGMVDLASRWRIEKTTEPTNQTESCQNHSRRTYQSNTLDVTRAAALPVAKAPSTDGAPGTTSDARTSTAQVVERSTSPTARWITSASVTNGHARVGEGLILGSFRSAGAAPVPCVRGLIDPGGYAA